MKDIKIIQKIKEINWGFKYFFVSVYLTFLFLIFILSMITVERNTRYIAFGDTKPFFEYNLKGNEKFIRFVIAGKNINLKIKR